MALQVRSKIWIENDQGKLVIGTGRLRILEAIKESGSMNKAAQMLNQPFRAVWGKIKATEERCGFALVERSTGGIAAAPRKGWHLLKRIPGSGTAVPIYADRRFRELFKGAKSNQKDAPGKD